MHSSVVVGLLFTLIEAKALSEKSKVWRFCSCCIFLIGHLLWCRKPSGFCWMFHPGKMTSEAFAFAQPVTDLWSATWDSWLKAAGVLCWRWNMSRARTGVFATWRVWLLFSLACASAVSRLFSWICLLGTVFKPRFTSSVVSSATSTHSKLLDLSKQMCFECLNTSAF